MIIGPLDHLLLLHSLFLLDPPPSFPRLGGAGRVHLRISDAPRVGDLVPVLVNVFGHGPVRVGGRVGLLLGFRGEGAGDCSEDVEIEGGLMFCVRSLARVPIQCFSVRFN